MVTLEYIASTALAAFFASLAAVAVSWLLDRSARRRDARAEILRACARHVDRLWNYSTVHSEVRTAGIGNLQTTHGQHAPFKPPMRNLVTEVTGVRQTMPRRSRPAIDMIVRELEDAEVVNDDRGVLADWQGEGEAVTSVARRVALWNGKSAAIPKE